MSLYLPPSPSNLREKQLCEKIWKWARRVLDETTKREGHHRKGHVQRRTLPPTPSQFEGVRLLTALCQWVALLPHKEERKKLVFTLRFDHRSAMLLL